MRRAKLSREAGGMAALVVAAVAGALGTGCGVPPDGGDDPATGVGATEDAIKSGTVLTDKFSGAVAIEVWSTTLGNFYTHCSGVLMSPNVVLTAKHCLTDPAVVGRTIYVRMGDQRKQTTDQVPHPSLDIAVLRFPDPMEMWNWSFNHYATSPPKRDKTTYRRSIYQGSLGSLNGVPLSYYGYGPGGVQTPLTTATFRTTVNDGYQPGGQPHLWFDSTPKIVPGDSGMGCSVGNDGYLVPVAFINQGTMGVLFAYGDSAEAWRGWFGY